MRELARRSRLWPTWTTDWPLVDFPVRRHLLLDSLRARDAKVERLLEVAAARQNSIDNGVQALEPDCEV